MGITPSLPIRGDVTEPGGFAAILEYKSLVKQNFRILLLTAPGTRMMDPAFGVGVQNYLFEQSGSKTESDLSTKIREQVALYLKYIEILDITFADGQSELDEPNVLHMTIKYYIKPLGKYDVIDLSVAGEGVKIDEF